MLHSISRKRKLRTGKIIFHPLFLVCQLEKDVSEFLYLVKILKFHKFYKLSDNRNDKQVTDV